MATKPSDHRIPFALGPDSKPASIDDVPRGGACNCTCPECGAPLVAKKGERRLQIWHFAHEAGANCAGALESSVHLAIKTIIEQEKRLLVPVCNVFRYPDNQLPSIEWTNDGEYVVPPYRYTSFPDKYRDTIKRAGGGAASTPRNAKLIEFDLVAAEQQEGNIRPDLVGIVGDKKLYIEVAVTHPIDGEKLRRIRARNTPALQILVPYGADGLGWERLRRIVLEQLQGKAWAYSPKAEALADEDFAKKGPFRQWLAEQAAQKAAEREKKEKEAAEQRAWRAAAVALAAQRQELKRQRQEAEAQERRLQQQSQREAERKRYAEQMKEAMRLEAIRRNEEDQELQQALEAQRRKRQAEEAREVAERKQAIARLQAGAPSPDIPLCSPVIFLDLDCAFNFDGSLANPVPLALFAEALGNVPCSIIVTSEVRYIKTVHEIAGLMAPVRGRHVGTTPILDKSNPYGTRQREIDAWLAQNQRVSALILDGAERGFRRGNRTLGRHGFSLDDAKWLKEWLSGAKSAIRV